MLTKKDTSEDFALHGGMAINHREFNLFRHLICQLTGISLPDSKTTMLSVRLSKCLRRLGLRSFSAYYQLLQIQGPESDEYRQFINCVTTNKTSFFRENHHFEFLAYDLKHRKAGDSIRVWSSACSTGEEAYSIAMTLSEAFSNPNSRDIRILASDIDTQVLHEAAEGLYDAKAMTDLPPTHQSRYFQPEQSSQGLKFRAQKALRTLVTFRHKNLIAPSWGINIKFDYIFCRNVLIYFDHETQDRILRRFISFLKPHAYLIVGHSEHLHWLNALIEPVGRTIYRVRGSVAR